MYPSHLILAVCLLFVAGSQAVKGEGEDEWGSLDNWMRTNTKHDNTIDIDDRPQGDVYDSSGYQQHDDVGEYSGMYDNEDDTEEEEEGSAGGSAMPPGLCQSLVARLEEHKRHRPTMYVPECKPNGDFETLQCHRVGSRKACWCVNRTGQEIVGSRKNFPDEPNCQEYFAPIKPERKPGVKSKPDKEQEIDIPKQPEKAEPEPVDEGIIIEKPQDPNNIPNMAGEPGVDIQTISPNENEVENNAILQNSAMKGENYVQHQIMQQPGILAGIIGGAVVGLLCAVLLVMFIVYRMRKKDEGSYALDEPKRSPAHHQYSRASTKEFYA